MCPPGRDLSGREQLLPRARMELFALCPTDQVQLSPCQPSRNTVCACQDGTFCPPEHPCEMCQKCQPRWVRCPRGLLGDPSVNVEAGDNATNEQRDPGTEPAVSGTSAPPCLAKICSSWGASRAGPLREVVKGHCGIGMGERVLGGFNTGAEQTPLVSSISEPAAVPEPQWNLVPAPGEDPMQSKIRCPGVVLGVEIPVPALSCPFPPPGLRGSFYTFAKKVYTENWKKFGRHLKLEENDVAMARTEDGVYEMLLTWQSREGAKASVNTLLEILEELNLGGVAEEISSILIQKGLFQAGAEGSGEQAAPPSFKPEPLNTSQNT
uniref:Death domain-containing protein n=1 Tax=Ficedula albicollis TaxID=59894 RepID=A0A803W5V1_FICAL